MKHFFKINLLFWIIIGSAQTKLELTPSGFQTLEMKTPNKSIDQLVQLSKSWAPQYTKNSYDVFEVTENSLSIETLKDNAFYYYNIGVKYNCDIKYSLKIVFKENKKYTVTFTVKEIYAENVLLKTTIANYFTPEGNLKEDFKDVKPSLETTANKIVKSYTNFIAD